MTLKNTIYLILSLCLIDLSFSSDLPNYITPCKSSDSNLNECAKKNANEALPFVLKGDKSIKLPSLVPYQLPEITINAGNNLKLTFKNCILNGLESVTVDNVEVDLKKNTLRFVGKDPSITMDADYNIEGRILVLPITGSGKSNITMMDISYDYFYTFDLVKGDDGKEYIKTKESMLKLDPKLTYYDFQNLFNGDPVLGPEMNKFLNENHKEVGKDLNPAIGDVISTIITHILLTLIEKVPFDQIFLS